MKFSEILEMMKVDSNIDAAHLDTASLAIPYLHSKWYNVFVEELRILKGIDTEYNILYKNKMEYYLGKAPDEIYEQNPLHLKILKQDVEIYLKSDEELIAVDSKRSLQKIKVETVEGYIKNINNRSFMIKNAIDFRKFVNGVA